jgi:hypothetical protein
LSCHHFCLCYYEQIGFVRQIALALERAKLSRELDDATGAHESVETGNEISNEIAAAIANLGLITKGDHILDGKLISYPGYQKVTQCSAALCLSPQPLLN